MLDAKEEAKKITLAAEEEATKTLKTIREEIKEKEDKLKKTEEAIATMQDALKYDPDSEFTHTTIGWNLLERGRHKGLPRRVHRLPRVSPLTRPAA